MTKEQAEEYERNLNTLKGVFEEFGMEIGDTSGDSEDCNGWACISNENVAVTAFSGEYCTASFTFRSVNELRHCLRKLYNK